MYMKIAGYPAEGPYEINNAPAVSGVYVILGFRNLNEAPYVADVGESDNIHARFFNHERASCWHRQGYVKLTVAVIRASGQDRMTIEKQIRAEYNPPCGER